MSCFYFLILSCFCTKRRLEAEREIDEGISLLNHFVANAENRVPVETKFRVDGETYDFSFLLEGGFRSAATKHSLSYGNLSFFFPFEVEDHRMAGLVDLFDKMRKTAKVNSFDLGRFLDRLTGGTMAYRWHKRFEGRCIQKYSKNLTRLESHADRLNEILEDNSIDKHLKISMISSNKTEGSISMKSTWRKIFSPFFNNGKDAYPVVFEKAGILIEMEINDFHPYKFIEWVTKCSLGVVSLMNLLRSLSPTQWMYYSTSVIDQVGTVYSFESFSIEEIVKIRRIALIIVEERPTEEREILHQLENWSRPQLDLWLKNNA